MTSTTRSATPIRTLRSILCLVALCVASLFALPSPAQDAKALRGVALVIGNGDYEHIAPLGNPASDAKAIEDLLGELGFDTDVSTDRDARRLARDLEDFAADAQGADVALLYYSGHGIEAGGENYFVATDADPASLAAGLVPVSQVLAELQAKVPVVIVMLDACRDSPFPAGATIALGPDAPPTPIRPAGLGETRSVSSFRGKAGKPDDANVGTVIAFAAEPGKVALDGDAGGNSPYSAAVLRHIGAMAGAEFGTVMRMVAEEVYLKTDGRQRPWVNESMRRLLYFGERVADPDGPEGAILKERRKLLLTIADLPSAGRSQIERIAARDGVPMDALYAMLAALGQSAPSNPAQLEKLLLQQAERLKQVLADRAAISATDPEITRLADLSRQAVEEGALATAISLNEQAKARVAALGDTIARAEEGLRQRRREFAGVYALSAKAYELTLDFERAAADYARAYAEVSAFDPRLAFDYKTSEAAAYSGHADYSGGVEAVERAVVAGREALQLSERVGNVALMSGAHHNLAVSLSYLGGRTYDAGATRAAIAEYRTSMELSPREQDSQNWASSSANLAAALRFLGDIEGGTTHYQDSVAAYRQAIVAMDPARQPRNWQAAQDGLGITLGKLGRATRDRAILIEAVTAHREALRELDKAANPVTWAGITLNLATAYMAVAEVDRGYDFLNEAVMSFRAALTVFNETDTPNFWSIAQDGLGNALQALGARQPGVESLVEAVAAHRAALRHRSREKSELDWSMAQNNLGNALKTLATRTNDQAMLDEAASAFRTAVDGTSKTAQPRLWTMTSNNLADLQLDIGIRRADRAALNEAGALYASLAEVDTREAEPPLWSRLQFLRAAALFQLAELSKGAEAEDAYRQSVEGFRASLSMPVASDRFREGSGQYNLGLALLRLGQVRSDRRLVGDAVEQLAASQQTYFRSGDRSQDDVIARQLANVRTILSGMK